MVALYFFSLQKLRHIEKAQRWGLLSDDLVKLTNFFNGGKPLCFLLLLPWERAAGLFLGGRLERGWVGRQR